MGEFQTQRNPHDTLKGKGKSMAANMIHLYGGAPYTQLHEIKKKGSYHLKLAGIWRMRNTTPPSPWPRVWKYRRSETWRKGEMLWERPGEKTRNHARVWGFILRLNSEKWCLAASQGRALRAWSSSGHLGSDSVAVCSKREDCFTRYIRLPKHSIFSFPTDALMQFQFFSSRHFYLWLDRVYSITNVNIYIFWSKQSWSGMTILRRVIKASVAVNSVPK